MPLRPLIVVDDSRDVAAEQLGPMRITAAISPAMRGSPSRIASLQFAIAGMNARIDHNLAVSLVDVMDESG